jgi:hypothetical protein
MRPVVQAHLCARSAHRLSAAWGSILLTAPSPGSPRHSEDLACEEDICADCIEGRVDDQDRRPLSRHPPMPPEWSNHDRTRPHIDFANLPSPAEGMLVTLFITVRKVAGPGLLLARPGRYRRPGREPMHGQAVPFVDHHEPRQAARPRQARHLGTQPLTSHRGTAERGQGCHR